MTGFAKLYELLKQRLQRFRSPSGSSGRQPLSLTSTSQTGKRCGCDFPGSGESDLTVITAYGRGHEMLWPRYKIIACPNQEGSGTAPCSPGSCGCG